METRCLTIFILQFLYFLLNNSEFATATQDIHPTSKIYEGERYINTADNVHSISKRSSRKKLENAISPFNSSYMLPVDYQQSYCPLRCNHNQTMKMYTAEKCYVPYCHVCNCERPACEIYDNCCPDVTDTYYPITYRNNETVINYYPKNDTRLYSPVLTCDEKFSDRPVLYIHSCPPEYTDGPTRKLCEHEKTIYFVTPESFTHVKDESTGVLYWNTYCARCNGVNQSSVLPFHIHCEHFMNVYTETDRVRLLRATIQHCIVVHIVHDYEHRTPCVDTRKMKYIDSCNSTSTKWKYNQEVATACQTLNKTIYKVFMTGVDMPNVLYKNIFCAMCHMDFFPLYGDCLQPTKSRFFTFHQPVPGSPSNGTNSLDLRIDLPFSLLLNIGQSSSINMVNKNPYEQGNCSHNYWLSPDGDCILLECTAGKVLHKRHCTTAFELIRGLSYNLNIILYTGSEDSKSSLNKLDIVLLKHLIDKINSRIDKVLKMYALFYMADINIIVATQLGSVGDFNISSAFTFWANFKIISNHNFTRDDFEDRILNEEILHNYHFTVKLNKSLTLKLYSMNSIGDSKNCSHFNSKETKVRLACLEIHKNISVVGNENEKYYMDSFINLKRTLTCRSVYFEKSYYELDLKDKDIPPIPMLTVYLEPTKLIFTKGSDLNMMEIDEDGVLKVCVELLEQKVKEIQRKEHLPHGKQSSWNVAYSLTLTCVTVSILCLILTLVTYMRFPVLRNIAGKNTMFLCSSLLLAQTSLLTSSHLTAPSMMCTASGISTHFLWLWMLSWSFTCSYHMFQIFTSNAPICITPHFERRLVYRNVFMSLILPSVAVSMVIIFSYVYTQGQIIGYGHVTCYLDSPLLNGVTFVGPLTLITISNVVFFGITVYKIQSTINLQSSETFRKDNQHHIYVYVKLSFMTGAFWALAIVAETVDNQVLRIISIIINGLQGVAIFVSYVCNKRVFNLYWNPRGRNSTMVSVVERNK